MDRWAGMLSMYACCERERESWAGCWLRAPAAAVEERRHRAPPMVEFGRAFLLKGHKGTYVSLAERCEVPSGGRGVVGTCSFDGDAGGRSPRTWCTCKAAWIATAWSRAEVSEVGSLG
jgi:hypothetical protein